MNELRQDSQKKVWLMKIFWPGRTPHWKILSLYILSIV
jgi:hypothetical protein